MTLDLERFELAHAQHFQIALKEVRWGLKRTHWMWYIFPQLKGLGRSTIATHYGIAGIKEAGDFLAHPVLGTNLILISEELLKLPTADAFQIFGSPDNLKLHSSMTLFSNVPGASPVFKKVLDKYFSGKPDSRTLDLLS